jgi:hypothetical protein
MEHNTTLISNLGTGGTVKEILDQMEEYIAAIRNLERNFDFYSKSLEKLMKRLNDWHMDNHQEASAQGKRRKREKVGMQHPDPPQLGT